MTAILQILSRRINQKTFSDFLVWISVILYLDPGGYFLQWESIRFSKTIFLSIIWIVFFSETRFNGIRISFRDKLFKRAITTCMLFLLYYIIFFIIVNDNYSSLSIATKFLKTRLDTTGWLLIIPVYFFTAYRSSKLFIKTFTITSFIIAVFVVLKITTGLELVNVHLGERGYVNVARVLLDGQGIMELGLYLLIAIFIIPKSFYYSSRNRLILYSLSIYLVYLFSLTRRYIVFVMIAIGAAYFIAKYFFGTRSRFQSKVIGFLIIISVIIAVFFNGYVEGVLSSVETLNVNKNSSYGTTYDRISLFEHKPTLDMFIENAFFGSGYNNEYYAKFENPLYGLEGSDYVFLSSLAMFGIVGVLLFLPFYVVLYLSIINGLKMIKHNMYVIRKNFHVFWPIIIVFLSTSLFFIKHLISYPNWFSFFGPNSFAEMYFIFAGLLFGSVKNLGNGLSDLGNSQVVDKNDDFSS